jgi:hypothetical protein
MRARPIAQPAEGARFARPEMASPAGSAIMRGLLAVLLVALCAGPARAQQSAAPAAQGPAPGHDTTALAKQTQNPVGDLTTIPLQFNFYSGGDLEDQTLFNLNVQPVIPFGVGQDWKVIAPNITANQDAADGERWTVPLGLGITRTTVFNRRPMNLGVQYYYNVERPTVTGAHQLRFVIALLYPGGH